MIFILGFWSLHLRAQMTMNGDTIYGNEWIRYDQRYFKLKVAEEAVYKVSVSELRSAGFPVDETEGRLLQLYSRGVQVPMYVNTDGALSDTDYLLFYGLPNRSEMDSFLYANGETDMLNPGFSLVNDTAAYFLTWNDSPGLRYEMVPNDLQNLPSPEQFFMDEIVFRQTASYIKRPNGAGSLSRFSAGEGFAGAAVVNAQADLPTPFFYAQGPEAQLEIRLASNNSRDHELQLLFNDKNLETLTFNNFNFISKKYSLPATDLLTQNKFNFNRLGAAENRYSLGIASLRYPSQYQLNNGVFKSWTPHRSGKQQMVWTGLNAATQEAWLLDPQTNRAVQAESSAGSVTFGYTPLETSTLVLALSNGFKVVPQILPITFENYTANAGNYLILSHDDLINGPTGNAQVQAYADYRSSSDGGSFNVTVADVRQIYDQFGWGVDRHFIALRNFFHYLHKSGAPVEHILLLGKGRDFRTIRTAAQVAAAASSFFVPTFGGPGADMLLVCGDQSVYPLYSLGRIPAVNGDDIRIYLDKVIEYENAQRYPIAEADRFWQKRVLHLSGGNNAAEQAQLRGILERMGIELSRNGFAGQTTAFSKQSSDPVGGSAPEIIYNLINTGLSMISFLGHSGSTTLDYDIDNLNIYTNRGKYPIFIALGCSVGNLHTPTQSFGERFNFANGKGTIVFLASTGLGYPSILENYGKEIYNTIGNNENLSIGTILQNVNRTFSGTGNRLFQESLEQHTLNGDPALKPNYQEGPDYVFDSGSIKTIPEQVTSTLDSFIFQVNVLNLGTNHNDSFDLSLERIYPGLQKDSLIIRKIKTEGYRTTVEIKLPTGKELSIGRNTINLRIDPDDLIAEKPLPEAKENNTLTTSEIGAGYSFFVFDVNAAPLLPEDFAVINNPSKIELKANTLDPFAPSNKYIFELDTAATFVSPFKIRHELTQNGGVLSWSPPVLWQDSVSYFWRVSSDSISEAEGYFWRSSSFTVVQNAPENGRGQFHADQKRLSNLKIEIDSNGIFRYEGIGRSYTVRNGVYQNNTFPRGTYEGGSFASFFPFDVLTEGICVVFIDPETGFRYRNIAGGQFGSINTTNGLLVSYPYITKEKSYRDALISLLHDTIPEGAVVMIYSMMRTNQSTYSPELWEEDSLSNNGLNLFNILENEGAVQIRELKEKGSVPFVLAYRKGEGLLAYDVGELKSDTVFMSVFEPERITSGNMEWMLPNTLKSLDRVDWSASDPKISENKKLVISMGKTSPKNELLDFTDVLTSSQNIGSVSSDSVYLVFESANEARHSHQLNYWTVYGTPRPDIIFNAARRFALSKDTLQQGESFQFEVALDATYTLTDTSILCLISYANENNVFKVDSVIVSFPDSLLGILNHTINTSDFPAGVILLSIEINQDKKIDESNYTNNVGQFQFYVQKDIKNPLLNVLFDGRSIRDGDLISSKPEITISLSDENPYLRLDDSTIFNVDLLRPGTTAWENIPLNSNDLLFVPSQENGKNKAVLFYKPEFLLDGEYSIRVSAKDASGNSSGNQPFQKQFQIITKQMISSLVNYPNPFSTRTKFLYTLTGGQSPEYYKIQIFTISGQLVREINHLEIGPLKVGTHLTDFEWDGRDAYGNSLANGVYIYRLHTKNSELNDVDHFETRSDLFSTNGWSKMVILR